MDVHEHVFPPVKYPDNNASHMLLHEDLAKYLSFICRESSGNLRLQLFVNIYIIVLTQNKKQFLHYSITLLFGIFPRVLR